MEVEPGAHRHWSGGWRRVLWPLIAWPAPAAIAGLAGWQGIWGSGSAFYDYLIPVPVAGGVLHVPSFAIATSIVFATAAGDAGAPSSQRTRRWIVPGLVAVGLVGALLLVDVERVFRALTTDLPFRLRLERNPLGLFLTTDAILALVFTKGLPFSIRQAAVVVVPIAVGVLAWGAIASYEAPIRHGLVQPGATRGDQMRWAYASEASLRTFEDRAFAYAREFAPERRANVEDVAIYFTSSAVAADTGGGEGIFATLCLFEDGTGPIWSDTRYDCFHHESFSDRMASGHFDLDAFCARFDPPRDAHPGGRADVEACRGRNR